MPGTTAQILLELNLLQPGAYTVTVTNRFGCTEEETFEVALFQPDIVAKLTHTCGSDGEISLTFTDGSGINTGSLPIQLEPWGAMAV
ncbi:MAG: hypothetical protein H6566_20220 [Lewinellaceae bacterium]|nr:hypothetical protein [Lewinellaceae bacterium]